MTHTLAEAAANGVYVSELNSRYQTVTKMNGILKWVLIAVGVTVIAVVAFLVIRRRKRGY